jgi:hypothetical protein
LRSRCHAAYCKLHHIASGRLILTAPRLRDCQEAADQIKTPESLTL